MADLVRGELADARQRHHRRRVVGSSCAGLVRLVVLRDQAARDQHVLPDAQRAEEHVALDDLAGARIDRPLPPYDQPRVERCTQLIML